MFIPFISKYRASQARYVDTDASGDTVTSPASDSIIYLIFDKESSPTHHLERRKGGGCGAKSRGPDSSSNIGESCGSTSGKTSRVSLGSGGLPNGKTSTTSSGAGRCGSAPIPLGQPFAGRITTDGKREEVHENSTYGSGDPGMVGTHGVSRLGFPFFWPIVWPGPAIGAGSYLRGSYEYGLPDNTSRPGGALTTAQFQSKNAGSTFYVLSDNSTISLLIGSLKANCSSNLNLSTTSESDPPKTFTNQSTVPLPEQALQYYRASSAVLTLDGYNRTPPRNDTQNSSASAPLAPLPDGTDVALLACLNETIQFGLAMQPVDAKAPSCTPGMCYLNVGAVSAGIACCLVFVKVFEKIKACFGGG